MFMSCAGVLKSYEEMKLLYDGFFKSFNDSDTKKILEYKKRFFQSFLRAKEDLLKIIDDPELLLLRGFLARKFKYVFVGEFHYGFAVAKIANEKYVIIDQLGERLDDNVYLDAGNFSDEFARIRFASRFTTVVPQIGFIKKNGSIVSGVSEDGFNRLFEFCHDFRNGFARVECCFVSVNPWGGRISQNYWNFLTKDLCLLNNKNYLKCRDFHNGFAEVQRKDGTWNFINENGDELNQEKYGAVFKFNENGCAIVYKGDETYGFINHDGNEKYLQNDNPFLDYLAFIRVQRKDGSWNFVNPENGAELNDEKYIFCDKFTGNGYASVKQLDGTVGFVDCLGRYADEMKYKACIPFSEGTTWVVTFDGLSNLIKEDGSELFQNGLPYRFHSFFEGIILVSRADGAFNFLKEDGTLLLGDDWLTTNMFYEFKKNDCAFVNIDDFWKILDKNGTFSKESYKNFEEIKLASQKIFFVLELADGSGKVIFD